MKHKHAEMIKTKADNMELVLFSMSTGSDYGKWSECKRETMPKDNENIKYFLCLPQHKEACLHWLNGGEIQDLFEGSWTSVGDYNGEDWEIGDNPFMNEEFYFRIKPKKEKRWVVVNPTGNSVKANLMKTTPDISEYPEGCQAIEIEVEV